jgi:hypothetical protein
LIYAAIAAAQAATAALSLYTRPNDLRSRRTPATAAPSSTTRSTTTYVAATFFAAAPSSDLMSSISMNATALAAALGAPPSQPLTRENALV